MSIISFRCSSPAHRNQIGPEEKSSTAKHSLRRSRTSSATVSMSSQRQFSASPKEPYWPTYLQRGPPVPSYMPAGSDLLRYADADPRMNHLAATRDTIKQSGPPCYQGDRLPPRAASAPPHRKRHPSRTQSPRSIRHTTVPPFNPLATGPGYSRRRQCGPGYPYEGAGRTDARKTRRAKEPPQDVEHTGDTTDFDSDLDSFQNEKERDNAFGVISTIERDEGIVLKPEPLPGYPQVSPNSVELDLEGDTLLDDTDDGSTHSRTSYGSIKRKASDDFEDDHIRLFRPPAQRLKSSPSISPAWRDRSKLKDVMTASRKLLAVQKLDVQIGPRLPDVAREPPCKLPWCRCPILYHFDLHDHPGTRTLHSWDELHAGPAPPACKIHPHGRDKDCHLRSHVRERIHRCAHAARACKNRLEQLAGLTDGWIKEELRVCGTNFEVLLREAWEGLWYCEGVGCQDNMDNDLDKENDPGFRQPVLKHSSWQAPMNVMQEGAMLVPAVDRGSPRAPRTPKAHEPFQVYESPTQAISSRRAASQARAMMPPPPKPSAKKGQVQADSATRPGTPILSSVAKPKTAGATAEKKQRKRGSKTPHQNAFDTSTSPIFTSERLRRDTILR